MSGSNPMQQLLKGTFVLAMASFLSKLMGVVYKIPYQNITGDLGFYVYEQVYPIYMILLTLATAGVPVAISKMVAERLAVGDQRGARQVFKASATLLTATGFLFFSALFFGAPVVAVLLGEPRLTLAIQSVSFALLVVPVMAAIRGYFQGQQNMMPTAVSQVVEQLVRVATIIFLSYWLISHQYDAFHAGAGAVFGAFTGAVAAFFVLLIYWQRSKKGRPEAVAKETLPLVTPQNGLVVAQPSGDGPQGKGATLEGYLPIIKKVVAYAVPISLGSLVLPLFQLMDSLTIPRFLQLSGWETLLAQEARGVYARGQPLVQFAAFFATALSLALVPSISEAKARGELSLIVQRTQTALKLTFLVGLGAAVGLATLARPINIMIYINDKGTTAMAVFAFVTIFSTLSITSGAVLQGMGYVTLPARHLLIGVGVKTLLNCALVPVAGISGAAFASVVGYMTAAGLNIRTLRRMLPFPPVGRREWLAPVVAVAVMALAVLGMEQALLTGFSSLFSHERLISLAATLLTIPVGMAVYFVMLILLGSLTPRELEAIPRLNRLVGFVEKLKRFKKEG